MFGFFEVCPGLLDNRVPVTGIVTSTIAKSRQGTDNINEKDKDDEEEETRESHRSSHRATKESESEMERTDFDESYEEKLEDEIDIDDTQQAMPVIKLPTFFL